MGWLKTRKLEYLENEVTFLQNKKIINLSLRQHILRNYYFVAELIFNSIDYINLHVSDKS